MIKRKRFEWIAEYIENNCQPYRMVNILDSYFVEAYRGATGAKTHFTCWGANKVPLLNKDLSEMVKSKYLKKHASGLPSGNWQPGFPKWVYEYEPHYMFYSLLKKEAAP